MEKYLDYPKDKPIHHNGLPVKFITGSDIHAYGDWDLIIERRNCSANYSYLGFTVNSASPATKTMLATDVINHSLLVGDPAKTVSSKRVNGTYESLTATQRLAVERSGTFQAYYYNEAYPVMGLKWPNGVPADGSANAPDLTNHGNTDGYSIIHKFYTTGTSLYKTFDASNYAEFHNIYAPNVASLDEWFSIGDDFYSRSNVAIMSNLYFPKADFPVSSISGDVIIDLTAKNVSAINSGFASTYVSGISSNYVKLSGCRVDSSITAKSISLQNCIADKLNSKWVNVTGSIVNEISASDSVTLNDSTLLFTLTAPSADLLTSYGEDVEINNVSSGLTLYENEITADINIYDEAKFVKITRGNNKLTFNGDIGNLNLSAGNNVLTFNGNIGNFILTSGNNKLSTCNVDYFSAKSASNTSGFINATSAYVGYTDTSALTLNANDMTAFSSTLYASPKVNLSAKKCTFNTPIDARSVYASACDFKGDVKTTNGYNLLSSNIFDNWLCSPGYISLPTSGSIKVKLSGNDVYGIACLSAKTVTGITFSSDSVEKLFVNNYALVQNIRHMDVLGELNGNNLADNVSSNFVKALFTTNTGTYVCDMSKVNIIPSNTPKTIHLDAYHYYPDIADDRWKYQLVLPASARYTSNLTFITHWFDRVDWK